MGRGDSVSTANERKGGWVGKEEGTPPHWLGAANIIIKGGGD